MASFLVGKKVQLGDFADYFPGGGMGQCWQKIFLQGIQLGGNMSIGFPTSQMLENS